MSETSYRGNISFVNYEKHFATIEYKHNNKVRSVNCKTDAADSGKKPHHFKVGDEVSFQLRLSDRGDKMTAYNIKYIHNAEIALLAQKAILENRFSGYLKKVDDKYFVKEWDSYIFFPLQLSPWEKPPADAAENEAITFRLLNIESPNRIVAELFSHNYIPAYQQAVEDFSDQAVISATVRKVSPHAVYVELYDGAMKGKLPVTDSIEKEEDVLQVKIRFINPLKIVIERAVSA